MSDVAISPARTTSADKLSQIRSILDEQAATPDAALAAIAEVVGRREPSGEIYQKPWG